MEISDILARILCSLTADMQIEFVTESRLIPGVIAQFQGHRVARHARLALAIAHVNLHQFENIARLLLQSLVFQRKHRLSDGILRPAEHVADRQILTEQAFLVDV